MPPAIVEMGFAVQIISAGACLILIRAVPATTVKAGFVIIVMACVQMDNRE